MFGLRQVIRQSLRLLPKNSIDKSCLIINKHPLLPSIVNNKSFTIPFLNYSTAIETTEDTPPDNSKQIGKVEKAKRKLIEFTCKKCQTRNKKTMSTLAYETGIVIIRCDGCKNNHLIADNLGWFTAEYRNIEKFMKLNGETVKTSNDYAAGTCEITNK